MSILGEYIQREREKHVPKLPDAGGGWEWLGQGGGEPGFEPRTP